MTTTEQDVGSLVRRWRERRRRSQLDVSIAAQVSTRHLSFIETGRATPSRAMIERLCDELDVPLRERNAFYLAAGLAPVHRERPLADLGAARAAVEAVLGGHEPNPAVAVNARWDLLAANRAMRRFLAGLPAALTGPPLNMLRATMHPDGLAPRLRNPAQWRAHTLRRVRRQLDRTAEPALAALLAELESYPAPQVSGDAPAPAGDIVTPMRLATEAGELSLLYAVTVFGSPRDVTLDEVAVETFFPADEATREALRALARDAERTGAASR
ncbi:helix-turn-helix domain-containing protein [Allonocardiopsis opalescens]|uniref:Helix-turn-helix protein n=1 Tax=Allonocardiopsis opalescens TaxID=1144618 RepID=A0A2T0QDE8_9ACTN|nr:helix-turn-helix transcriptional regulator [Allonocardiopsis opalescens]PRY01928.1 helix-turn-helix protein [Allonocardiopsis opalescens]